MCRLVIIKLQCKKANCTNIYGSFRDDEESEYCEHEGSNDPNHQVRQRTRTEKGDEYCPDCEANLVTRRLTREVNQERARNNPETTRERAQMIDEQRRQREENERRREEQERQERETEEYRRTGRWPGVDLQSGFFSSRGHQSRKRR